MLKIYLKVKNWRTALLPTLKGEQKHFGKFVCYNKMLLEEEGIRAF